MAHQPVETTIQAPALRRRAQIVPDSYDPAKNTIEVTFSTGEESIEYDPFPGPFIERLSFEEDHLDLSRMRSGSGAVLDAHGSWGERRGGGPKIADQVGVVEDAWVVTASEVPGQSDARARLRLSSRDSLAELRQDIQDGIVGNVSVGYKVFRYRDITQPDDQLPVKLAVAWQPFEISFVPVGEDAGARTRAATDSTYSCTIESSPTEVQPMVKPTGKGSPPAPAPNAGEPTVQAERQRGLDIRTAVRLASLDESVADELIALEENGEVITADRARAIVLERLNEQRGDDDTPPAAPPTGTPSADQVQAERQRGLDIRQAVRLASLGDEFADELVAMNTRAGEPLSIDRCRALIFDRMAEQAEETGGMNGSHISIGADQFDKVRSGITNALEARCGVKGVEVTEHGRAFIGMRLTRLAEEFFTQGGMGEHVRGLNDDRMAGFALGRFRSVSAGHAAADFPLLLANVANKKLRMGYDATPSAWKLISSRSDASDFKTMSRTALGDFPALTQVREGAEYEMGTIGEGGETYAIAKYGKRIAFTREAMINDDLRAFDRLPRMAGRSAAELESDIMWAIITNNAAMADGTALFHADHGNLGSGALAASAAGITALGSGRAAMRLQTGIDGQRIGVAPRFLIVPAELETNAQSLTAAVSPTAASTVNPFTTQFDEVIVEPRLSADSAVKWYMAAHPDQVDILEHAYLLGNDGPTIETREGFEIDGMEMKVRHEFGGAVIDHRGIYQSTGV